MTIALIIDILFGELPFKVHPVVWMGKIIDILRQHLIDHRSKISGIILTLVLVIIFTLATHVSISLSAINNLLYILVSSIILTTTFAINILISSAEDIRRDIDYNIDTARKNVSYLVSRDTANLSSEEIVSATVETLTENITDSVIAPIFYAFIFGVPGAVAYRAVNTLDAMVGYKKHETIKIGWFPAKLDDILNYLPARITGIMVIISALLLGMDWQNSYKIMIRDAKKPDSPNSGYSMAAAAGALGIKLKKIGYYEIGDNLNPLKSDKILDALKLTKVTIILFLIFVFTIYFFAIHWNGS
ncbi:MAG: cobalamin biosynthesis protein [Methanobacterium sp.]|jgi:adenosylcobinamide-phosphate synthase